MFTTNKMCRTGAGQSFSSTRVHGLAVHKGAAAPSENDCSFSRKGSFPEAHQTHSGAENSPERNSVAGRRARQTIQLE